VVSVVSYKKPDVCTPGSTAMPSGILFEAVMDYFVFTKHDSESVFITVMKDSLCYPICHQF
jgi:hypothetical protein